MVQISISDCFPTFCRSVKQISALHCCAVDFNDFTLDGGATNPNSMHPPKRKGNSASNNLDANYEKRRAAIVAKNDKKDQKAAFRANKRVKKSSGGAKKRFGGKKK